MGYAPRNRTVLGARDILEPFANGVQMAGKPEKKYVCSMWVQLLGRALSLRNFFQPRTEKSRKKKSKKQGNTPLCRAHATDAKFPTPELVIHTHFLYMLARVRSNATRRLSCKQHNSRSEAPPQLRSHPSPFFSRSFAVRWKRYLASSAYDIEETLGFNRPCTKPLPSSVDEYYRHIIIVRLSHNV
jgi:hypothetical protein